MLRRHHWKGTALAGCEEAREKELKCLRELGVYEVDEHAAVAKHSVTPIDTKWVDNEKHLRGSRCKSVHELLPESSKAGTGRTCMR